MTAQSKADEKPSQVFQTFLLALLCSPPLSPIPINLNNPNTQLDTHQQRNQYRQFRLRKRFRDRFSSGYRPFEFKFESDPMDSTANTAFSDRRGRFHTGGVMDITAFLAMHIMLYYTLFTCAER